MTYTIKDANKVVNAFSEHRIACALIGSIARRGTSDHDIDVLLPYPNLALDVLEMVVTEVLHPYRIIPTDWGGIYCWTEEYGDVDVFLKYPRD